MNGPYKNMSHKISVHFTGLGVLNFFPVSFLLQSLESLGLAKNIFNSLAVSLSLEIAIHRPVLVKNIVQLSENASLGFVIIPIQCLLTAISYFRNNNFLYFDHSLVPFPCSFPQPLGPTEGLENLKHTTSETFK